MKAREVMTEATAARAEARATREEALLFAD
jgi:hypothetical protein